MRWRDETRSSTGCSSRVSSTPDAHAEAVAQPLEVALHRDRVESGAYFLEEARKEIEQRYGTDALYTSGLQVHLTMDPYLQQLAEHAVREWLIKLEMIYIGWRSPPNVLASEDLESVEDYQNPSWRQLELKPGAMVKAVVAEVGRREAQLKLGDHRARLDMDGGQVDRGGFHAATARGGRSGSGPPAR